MPKDRFIIAPFSTGLQNDVKPWLLTEDAFSRMNNCMVYKNQVVKRFGSTPINTFVSDDISQLYTRVAIKLGTSTGEGIFNGTVPNGSIKKVGQIFSIGDEIFTVTALGLPANLLSTGVGTGTYNTNTGAVVFTNVTPDTDVYFYQAEQIMALASYQQPELNNERTIVFDTTFAYEYQNSRFERLGTELTAGSAIWTGTNTDFFWSITYRGALSNDYIFFVTNNNTADLMRYFDGTSWGTFNPFYKVNHTIKTCLCIVAFKDRLILLNTAEEETVMGIRSTYRFSNRIRFSFIGDPFSADAFLAGTDKSAGFLDASTREAIVGCKFIKDRLIIFFERSAYELAYTGNRNAPFVLQRINSELGIESTYSLITFDQNILGIGETGIYTCNGSNMSRIDEKIPYESFKIRNDNDGIKRVYGVRDYFNELVYWSYPDAAAPDSTTYPNRVLVYNYKNGAWSINDDTITAFGNFNNINDLAWEDANIAWRDAKFSWENATSSNKFLNIVAGNQQGFVSIVSPESTSNADSISITNITIANSIATVTAVDHNLNSGDYIKIRNVLSTADEMADLNDVIHPIVFINADTFTVPTTIQASVAYLGAGTVQRITPFDLLTKQYNFYVKDGVNFAIDKIDFQVDRTAVGLFNVNWMVSTSNNGLFNDSNVSDNILPGTGVVVTRPYEFVPQEINATRLWHSYYLSGTGSFVQLRLYLSDENIKDNAIVHSDFTLHAMIFYTSPTSSRISY